MKEDLPDVNEFLPLTPAMAHVLLALADQERHGYSIMQEVQALTQGQISMGPGTLYGTIKRMLKANLIEESEERPDPEMDDQRRRYYRLSGLGRRVLRAEMERLAMLVNAARNRKILGSSEGTL